MRGARPVLFQYVFMTWNLVKHRDNFTAHCKFVQDVCGVEVKQVRYRENAGLLSVVSSH